MNALETYSQPARLPASDAARFARLLALQHADTFTDVTLARIVAKGLPTSSVAAFAEVLASPVLGRLVPEATVRRAKRTHSPLSREHSERLYEVARVIDAVSRAYHGDRGRIEAFLNHPHALLDGETPFELAISSSAGADAVLNLLRRAEASVPL